ncbi:MAG: DUF2157 domain-containing protein [Synergistaceae bacterium]|nr:DUF2157 domain-containing protein [Synergistaceae bacterium]
MERGISESKHRFLADESRAWVEREIITSGQRDSIMECYVTAKKFPVVALTLGVASIGIGVLSIIAANWRYMPPVLKIAIIVGVYIGSVGAAYFCEKKRYLIVSDVLLFLSGFILLGGLALLSQVFHIEGAIDGLFLTWLVVYAPTFLLVRNISIFILYEIVSGAYICAAFMNYYNSSRGFYDYDGTRPITLGLWQPLVVILVVVAVAWWEWYRERGVSYAGSRSKLRDFFVGGSTRRLMLSNFLIIIWFSCLCLINSRHESALPYVIVILIIGVAIQILARRLDATDLDWQAMLLISLCGLALSFDYIWDYHFWRYDDHFKLETIGSSAALGVYLAWRILSRAGGSGWATVFFCLLLARWYFDMFFDFMDKGIFFVVGGALLIAISVAYSKWKKHGSVPAGGSEGNEQTKVP